jgi:hypothetical protein
VCGEPICAKVFLAVLTCLALALIAACATNLGWRMVSGVGGLGAFRRSIPGQPTAVTSWDRKAARHLRHWPGSVHVSQNV